MLAGSIIDVLNRSLKKFNGLIITDLQEVAKKYIISNRFPDVSDTR